MYGPRKLYQKVAAKVNEWGKDLVGSAGYSQSRSGGGSNLSQAVRGLSLMPGAFS